MKIVFLDRDGVINQFPGNGNYVTKVKDFHFIPRSLDAIRILTEDDYYIFIISNQAGVGKGIYSKTKLNQITHNMLKRIRQHGGRINDIFYCTHRSDVGCDCRKPGIGSIRKALGVFNKSIRSAGYTYFIGDTVTDIQTGKNAGCKTIFVLSGRENRRHLRKKKVIPDFIAQDLFAAVKIIQTRENT